MGLFLILLSFCTYPIVLRVWPEQQAVWHGTYATDIFTYFRAILICVSGLLLSPRMKNFYPLWFYLLFFLTLSTVFSHYPKTALFGTPNHYEGFLVICAYYVFAMQKELPEKAIRYSVYIVGVLGLIQLVYGCYFLFPPIRTLVSEQFLFEAQRFPVFSTFGNTNHLGLFCALLFPFFLGRKDILVSVILLALLVVCQSRGAWVSVVITTAYQYRKNIKSIALILCLCLLACLPRAKETIDSLHWPIRPNDGNARVLMWLKTIPMLKDKWLLGAGPGAYALDFPNGTDEMEKFKLHRVVVDRPHNIYLHTWYTTGFLSLLVWFAIILDFFHSCKDKAIKAAILGFLIAGLFTDSVVSVTPYFMVMLGAKL